MDLRRLRMLRELAERGTLAAVATALGYTPSAVSQQLAVLEKEAGVRVLERAGRVLVPVLGRLRAEHPQVRVEISELELEQALPELRLGTLDVVVSDEYDGHPRPRPAGLRLRVLLDEPLRLVLPAGH